MKQCPICKFEFYSQRGLEQHFRKFHDKHNIHVPDLIGIGVMKRRLTRKEAKEVTKEVMDMNIKDEDLRFTLAVMKSIDKVSSSAI